MLNFTYRLAKIKCNFYFSSQVPRPPKFCLLGLLDVRLRSSVVALYTERGWFKLCQPLLPGTTGPKVPPVIH